MPKAARINKIKSDKRKVDVQTLKDRGPASNEKSVPQLRERVAIIEEILEL